jgi:hypothetical protein
LIIARIRARACVDRQNQTFLKEKTRRPWADGDHAAHPFGYDLLIAGA